MLSSSVYSQRSFNFTYGDQNTLQGIFFRISQSFRAEMIFKMSLLRPRMVAQAFNPSIWEAEESEPL